MKSGNKKSNDLKNRLKSYSAVAGGLAAFAPIAGAQIVYTDLDPDVNILGSTYFLDLNNDGDKEFYIFQNHFVGTDIVYSMDAVMVNFYDDDNNKFLIDLFPFGTSYFNLVLALNQGDTIDNNQTIWDSHGMLNAQGTHESLPLDLGHWRGVSDKYIGFRFHIGSNVHYGWARLSVNAGASFATIKDYAYNSDPDSINSFILAGQTIVGLNNHSADNEFNVYSFNKKLVVECENENVKNTVISIFNTTGQEVKQIQINNKRTEIDMNDITSGIYLVRLMNENGTFSRKISIN